MIQKQTPVVALMDMLTHIHKSTYAYATPEAEPRGILLIKTYGAKLCNVVNLIVAEFWNRFVRFTILPMACV